MEQIGTRTITVETTHQVTVGRDDLLKMVGVPENATNVQVYVYVPGGGDWSSTNLDIEKDCPVIVTYKTIQEKYAFY